MTTCTQVAVGSLFVLTLTACGGGGGSSEPAQASADPDSTIEWQGDWQVDTSYALNDIVYSQGQAFINVLPTTGSESPQDTDHWELLVDRGETGPIGPQGVAGLDGAAGPTGPAGPQGIAGAIGPAGPESLVWQGAYTGGNSYQVSDVVSFNGSAYISIQDTTGTEDPSDTSYWELLAEKGTDGSAGPQGPTGVAGNDGVAGPQGVAGADGVIGPTGPAGPQGIAGADGAVGPTGSTGPQGIAGADGAAGPTGSAGPQGAAGADGATGPAGPASLVWQGAYIGGNNYQINDAVSFNGSAYISIQDTTGTEDPSDTSYWELLAEKGTDGSAGPQGPTGVAGNDGATGPQGVAGADGATGPTGATGPQGVAGADGASGPTGLTGPQGVAGADGATGSAGPASLIWQGAYTGGNSYQINDAVSFNGSAYISIQDTSGTEDPSDASFWELLAQKGADGSAGPQGPIGATGNDGATGPQGVAGADGATGPTGATGPQGVAGPQGPVGATGPAGADGNNGQDGAAGAVGPQGLQGEKGLDWQGVWQSGVVYLIDDAVFYQGSAYIAIQQTTGSEEPGNTAFWDLLSATMNSEMPYQAVGFSSTQVSGISGYVGINGACQSDFGSSARIATTVEFMLSSASFPTGTGDAWIQNHFASNSRDLITTRYGSNVNCSSWSENTANGTGSGQTVDLSTFHFGNGLCADSKPVMCAVPTNDYSKANRFVGFSSNSTLGSAGLKALNTACQQDFGSTARLATEQEVFNASDVVAQSGIAWVQNMEDDRQIINYQVTNNTTYNITCKGWTSSGGPAFVVDGNLSAKTQSCSTSAKVACSIP